MIITLLSARPLYRKKCVTQSPEFSFRGNPLAGGKISFGSTEAPAMLMPSLAHSRSVVEAIQEVKMVQVKCSILRQMWPFP